jgi:3-oxoacid CoA-transferase subunit A
MSILFSGDFHSGACGELEYLTKSYLMQKYGRELYDEISCHIILGDGGFLWPGRKQREASNLKILSERPFPVLCVCGNHEPVLGRTDLPEIDIGLGEKVIVVSEAQPLVAYLKRGKVYHIDGRKFLVLGGALSVDKDCRIPTVTWWKNEYWTQAEEAELFSLLEKDRDFDYVLSHTGPNRINKTVFAYVPDIDEMKFTDEVAALNDKVDATINCKQWYCGHWHHTFYYYDEELKRGYQYLYEDTILMEDTELYCREEGA